MSILKGNYDIFTTILHMAWEKYEIAAGCKEKQSFFFSFLLSLSVSEKNIVTLGIHSDIIALVTM